MNGGSYDYLCYAAGDAARLSGRRMQIEQMASRLDSMGHILAARATRDIGRLLDGAERASQALEDVWHAVEWADSGDWPEDQIGPVVAKFSPWPPPVPTAKEPEP